jgi:phosphatidylinositol-3-phosphatase
VIGSADAPYLNRLARENVLVDRSYAITHPSLPNYLALLAGDTFGITSDCIDCFLDQPNLVDALEARDRSWKAYLEDLPAPCSLATGTDVLGVASGLYVLKHNPFLYFQNIRTNPSRCNRVVPLTQLDADLTSGHTPDFAWITPNLQHDTHDAAVADGDRWLADFVPRVLSSPAWRPGALLIVTWDEGTTNAGCCGLAAGGHVPTVLVRAGHGQARQISDPVTHYSILRTVEDLLRVDRLGLSAAPQVHPLLDRP